jgi:hypothetical protein
MATIVKFSRLFKPPAPLQLAPVIEQWGPSLIQIDHLSLTASVQLIATDATGAVIPNAPRRPITVRGAAYVALFASEKGAALAADLEELILAAGLAAEAEEMPKGTTIVDAKQ